MQNNKIGSGLHNLGNTCFFNAVMQVMLYTPALVTLFSQKKHSSTCRMTGWCIFCNLEKLWEQSKTARVVSPNAIVSNLRSIFKKFRLGRQEDSHQFLRYLVEGLQQSETGKLGKDQEKNDKAISKTYTYSTFGGRMRTFVLCLNCKHKSLTTERYYDLSIQCQKSNSIAEGLENYFKVDDLSGSNKYRCDACKQLSNAKKGFRIISVPDVVTFQLKRFTNSLRKLGKLVEYPKTLDLSKYMQNVGEQRKLELYGVVVHAGSSAGSGHYYAFVKNGSQWYQMNDSNVCRTTEDRVLKQQAYLLFYRSLGDQRQQTSADRSKEVPDTMTNLKISKQGEKDAKIQKINGQEGTKSQRASLQKKKAEKTEQNLEETKRKLSLDFEQLKKQALSEKIKTSQDPKKQTSKQQTTTILNGKQLNSLPLFGSTARQNNEQEQSKKNATATDAQLNEAQDQLQSEEEIDIPLRLQRKKSKGQIQSSMPYAELVMRNIEKIYDLRSRMLRANTPRALKSIMKLRKFQISSKRRKIG